MLNRQGVSNDLRRRYAYSRYSSWALVGLSLVGLFSCFYGQLPTESTLIIIAAPYSLALLFGIALLFGQRWAAFPIVLISVFGVFLNVEEIMVKEGPNQKDILEVILFLLIIFLIMFDEDREHSES